MINDNSNYNDLSLGNEDNDNIILTLVNEEIRNKTFIL